MSLLKFLEVENFKSYRGRQVIGPFSPFTAVIGPNGSGKSNLMDAISFVFGEKTSHLRVKTVKELIHGAQVGHPVSEKASVTAVCQQNGEDVRFTRTVVGSGTTYAVNKKTVNKEEYIVALDELGLNMKARNFLVFQGEVESMAMRDPRDLTPLFEDISGSGELAAEFENRRKEMLQLESEVQQKMERRKALASERKTAKVENEEADKVQKLENLLEQRVVELELFKLYHLDKEIEESHAKQQSVKKELKRTQVRQQSIDKLMAEKKSEVAKLQRERTTWEKKIKVKENERSKLSLEFGKAKQEKDYIAKRLEKQKKKLDRLIEEKGSHDSEVASLRSELESLESQARLYQDQVSGEGTIELNSEELEHYRHLKDRANKQVSAIREKLNKARRAEQSDEASLKYQMSMKDSLVEQKKNAVDRMQELQARVKRLNEYLSENRKVLEEHEKQYQEMEHNQTTSATRLTEISSELEEVEEKLQEVHMSSFEDEKRRKRADILSALQNVTQGVYGRVYELCEAKHHRHMIALVRSIGRHLDDIVVENAETAKICIKYLRDQIVEGYQNKWDVRISFLCMKCLRTVYLLPALEALGVEYFLPMTDLKVKPIDERLRSLGGTAKLMLDCVKLHVPEVKKAIQFCVGNDVVCENVDEARDIAYKSREGRTVITLEGIVFHEFGGVSAGFSELKKKAKRWNEKNVDNVRQQREQLVAEMKHLKKDRTQEAELLALKAKLDAYRQRQSYCEHDIRITEEMKIPQSSDELKKLDVKVMETESLISDMTAAVARRTNIVEELEQELNSKEDQVFADFCTRINVSNIRQYEEGQLKVHEERAQRLREYHEQITRLKNQLGYEQSRKMDDSIAKVKQSIKKDKKEVKEKERKEGELSKDTEECASQLKELEGAMAVKQQELDEKNIELNEVKTENGENQRQTLAFERRMMNLSSHCDQKCAERHRILKKCKMESLNLPLEEGSQLLEIVPLSEAEMSHSAEGISGSEGIDSMSSEGARLIYDREQGIKPDYSSLADELCEEEDLSKIKSKGEEMAASISDMQNKLRAVGAYNPHASDRLKDADKRLRDAADDLSDLRKRAQRAEKAFMDVQQDRYTRFMEAFDVVKDRVDEIYKSICYQPGAQAALYPDNITDPYLGAIMYECIPPGKRFLPMRDLSGGEKTIAALALVFALRSFRHPPFFVLDEVDAALDRTNIHKVARYVKKECEKGNFQCIVISLKLGLYEHADALIGVSRKNGATGPMSQILTLDLTQYADVPYADSPYGM